MNSSDQLERRGKILNGSIIHSSHRANTKTHTKLSSFRWKFHDSHFPTSRPPEKVQNAKLSTNNSQPKPGESISRSFLRSVDSERKINFHAPGSLRHSVALLLLFVRVLTFVLSPGLAWCRSRCGYETRFSPAATLVKRSVWKGVLKYAIFCTLQRI